jgi:hypothetical protein
MILRDDRWDPYRRMELDRGMGGRAVDEPNDVIANSMISSLTAANDLLLRLYFVEP